MANGKPRDHPITDILIHKLEVYGTEADDLIRRIAKLSSPGELNEWWDREIAWSEDKALVLKKARARYDELLERAKRNGWELPDDT